ncbi:hypothetical protein [Acinetobacter piscicola]|uniref:hypothetical protein n=1 Tax=Acinetobacter piscicola TaxID=2006115 RepID=UPI001020D3FA|nr:hypothetical protein [Acinetobacter piscicola]RYL25647.1 hypothetical protein EWP19_12075 [Acinetobacter piscicola]
MMKTKIILMSVLLLACTGLIVYFFTPTKTIYLHPEAIGTLYDQHTGRPLAYKTGDIGYYMAADHRFEKTLSAQGAFQLPAFEIHYKFFRPNMRKLEGPLQIYIAFEGYEGKIYDYSEVYWQQVPDEKNSPYIFNKIDVGKIYLNPKK